MLHIIMVCRREHAMRHNTMQNTFCESCAYHMISYHVTSHHILHATVCRVARAAADRYGAAGPLIIIAQRSFHEVRCMLTSTRGAAEPHGAGAVPCIYIVVYVIIDIHIIDIY